MLANNFYSLLRDKKVVIVGASSGIGLALARACAALEANVVMSSRSLDKLAEAQKSVVGKTEIVEVDMLDENSARRLFERVGKFDHLIVTAVADELKLKSRFAEMTTATAQRSLEKFWGSFFIARAAVPHISKNGSITLTSSIAAVSPPANGGYAVMNAASAAVAAFGRSLAAELKPVRVNVIAPGTVNTGVWKEMNADEAEAFRRRAGESLPVQHLGEPEELANAFLFLMTNTYATGTILTVDGGALLT